MGFLSKVCFSLRAHLKTLGFGLSRNIMNLDDRGNLNRPSWRLSNWLPRDLLFLNNQSFSFGPLFFLFLGTVFSQSAFFNNESFLLSHLVWFSKCTMFIALLVLSLGVFSYWLKTHLLHVISLSWRLLIFNRLIFIPRPQSTSSWYFFLMFFFILFLWILSIFNLLFILFWLVLNLELFSLWLLFSFLRRSEIRIHPNEIWIRPSLGYFPGLLRGSYVWKWSLYKWFRIYCGL